ncbi:MAG: hypothetical protein M3P85_01655 [Actinomycetota bacterium]|nr:hypothetical protein [Actinomycetota bacterium]
MSFVQSDWFFASLLHEYRPDPLLEQWKPPFASDPGPWMWVLGAPETQADSDRAKRVALHEEHVRECLDASQETKRAMNKVERWTYPPLR